MESSEIHRLLVEIGHQLSPNSSSSFDKVLLHVVIEPGMVGPSIFENHGNQILYRTHRTQALSDALFDLWYEEEPGKRWAEMEYLLHDDRFDVTYHFADEIDPDEDPGDRRDRIVRQYFGDKPIVYPPLSHDDAPYYDL